LSITRTNALVNGYFNSTLIAQTNYVTGPARFQIILQNNYTENAIPIVDLLGSVLRLSPHAAEFYLMQFDDLGASLFLASLPPAPGLATRSCSFGQKFASGSSDLRLAASA